MTPIHFRGENIHAGPRSARRNADEDEQKKEGKEKEDGESDRDIDGVLHV
jgi:hypothetical protein